MVAIAVLTGYDGNQYFYLNCVAAMDAIENLEVGAVRCVFSSDPPATIKSLLAWGKTRVVGERVAVCDVDISRPIYAVTDDLVCSLAKAALAVWPDWYDGELDFQKCDETSLQAALDRFAANRVANRQRSILKSWLSRAVTECRANMPPVIDGFSSTVQLQQLALALADRDLTLIVRVMPAAAAPDSTALIGLSRNLEWASRHVTARVVAVLPAAWSGRAELDGVTWESRYIDVEMEHVDASEAPSLDEPLLLVCPVRGRPHPNSPGEQLIAARLSRDPVLGPLFEYNKTVTTVRESRYIIDLVWMDGKVAVEIDGFRCHTSRIEFANDRHRDYELQLSGYLVLRLPHDSVIADVELAIDKIRDMTKIRMTSAQFPSRTYE